MQQHEALWNEAAPYLEKFLDQGLPERRVAEFCGVTPSTVQRWLSGKGPNGLALIKVRYLVETGGATLTLLPRITPEAAYTFDLLGYGVITLEEAMGILDQGQTQMFYRVYRGQTTTKKPTFSLVELVELYGDALNDAKERCVALFANIRNDRDVMNVSVVESVEESMVQSDDTVQSEDHDVASDEVKMPDAVESAANLPDTVILGLASTLSSALPSLRLLTDLNTQSELHKYLRPLLGTDAMQLFETLFCTALTTNPEPEVTDLDETVRDTAKLLRKAAPKIRTLYDDESSDGALARESLRQTVGPETFSVLAVQLTAMRSRQAYEKAQKGAIN